MKKTIITLISFMILSFSFSQKGKHVVEYHYKELKKKEGYFLKKQQSGFWKYWNMEGDLEKIETYSNGRLNGTYTEFKTSLFFNTQKMDIIKYWEDNYEYFLRKQRTQNHFDTLVIGYYSDDLRNGEWTFFENSRMFWKYTYKDDKKNGPAYRYSFGDLDIMEHYKDDLKHGMSTDYYWHNDVNKLETYAYGLKNGPSYTYHYDGKLVKSCTYKNDTLNGECYDSSVYGAQEVVRSNYKMGILHGKYMKSSKIYDQMETGSYVNGKKEGEWYKYSHGDMEMYTYVSDTLSGPYKKTFKYMTAEDLTGVYLADFYMITNDTSGFGELRDVVISGNYLNRNLATVKIYEKDTIPVASFTGGKYGYATGEYKLYKKGKLYFEGSFDDGYFDKYCIYYYPSGKVSELRKYKLADREMNYYDITYQFQTYSNGNKYSVYDGIKREKKFYWENGLLRGYLALKDSIESIYTQKLYDKTGKLYSAAEYSSDGTLLKEKIYDKTKEDNISILYDENFYLGIPEVVEPVLEEVWEMVYVEEQPEYPGGSAEMERFLNLNFIRSHGEGKIVIECTIDQYGYIKDVQLIQDEAGNGNGIEMTKTVMKFPAFKPGKIQGRPVRAKLVITCELTDKNKISYDYEITMEKEGD